MDESKFKDGRVNLKNPGVKELINVWLVRQLNEMLILWFIIVLGARSQNV